MKSVVNIILMFLVLCLLSALAYKLFGVNVKEGFLFCNPDDCSCVCQRMEYAKYCDSPYLKQGPAALCNCKWDASTRTCNGSRASDSKCAI